MKAILVREVGGPDQMKLEEVPAPKPGPGHVRVRVQASGVNFIDTYFRTGLYKADLPLTPGQEGAGLIDEVGPDVTGFQPGDAVVYTNSRGSYAEFQSVPAAQLIPLPAGLEPQKAAAVLLQGMTAHYLSHSTFPLQSGHTALIHAAAGATGSLLVQMAKTLGARVLATVSTEAKAEQARLAGADEVILYTEQDFSAECRRLTDGRGVDVVYDSVGATTWEGSLNALRPRGMMVSFGNASGPVPAVAPLVLSQKGSLFLTRPTLANYTATREELLQRAGEVLGAVASGALNVRIDRTYPLAEAPQAHRDLEGRKSMGKLMLQP